MSAFASELLKLRTVRVPYVFVAVMTALSAIAAAALVGTGALGDDENPALSLAQGATFSGILALVLGILIVTNEYRHATINSTFLADPSRSAVLGAKVGAAVVAALVLAVAAAVAALAVAIPWGAARGESVPLDAELADAGLRLFAVYALNCVLGVGLGALIQNQVGAIVAALGWFFIGESIVTLVAGLLSSGVGEEDPVTRFLPGSTLQGIVGFSQGDASSADFLLEPLPATLLATLYAAALAALGALSMTRRDP